MYVESVPNRNSPPAVLLRESSRLDGRIVKRTLANLSHWPPAQVDALRRVLKGESLVSPSEAFQIQRSVPHGHVAAALGTLRRAGLEPIFSRALCPQRDLVVAMIVARILEPSSKLATARGFHPETATSSLASVLGLDDAVDESQLYKALDWLLQRQSSIERALAQRHLGEGSLVLYDVSSTYFEGRHCPLARFGHSRDERSGNPQIIFGLLTNSEGCPVAVEVFEGNTGDPKTVASQVSKLRAVAATHFGGGPRHAHLGAHPRRSQTTGRDRVDFGAQVRTDSNTGAGRTITGVPVRSTRFSRDPASLLPGRAVDCLPQSVAGRGEKPQAKRIASSHGEAVEKDCGGHPAKEKTVARPQRDWSGCGKDLRTLQNG